MDIELLITDTKDCYTYALDYGIHSIDLEIFVTKQCNLEKRLSNKMAFKKDMDERITYLYDTNYDEEAESLAELVNDILNDYEHFFDRVEYVRVYSSKKSLKDMIEENPMIKTKKIVVGSYSMNDFDKLEKLASDFEDIKDHLYVSLEGNNNYVSLSSALMTINEIINQVGFIKSCNLSQLETIMMVYDFVRERIYRFEDDNQDYVESRDLTRVLFGDRIVCAGFTNLFNSMLSYLGIETEYISYKGKVTKEEIRSGHARSLIKVDDPKYKVNGLFLFDPTWDSKSKEGDNSYLLRYKYFARNFSFMKKYDDANGLTQNIFFQHFENDESELIKKAFENNDENLLKDLAIYGSHLSRKIIGKNLVEAREIFLHSCEPDVVDRVVEDYNKVYKSLRKEIPAEKMLLLTNNVRKIEYYYNHECYPYSIDDLYQIAMRSKWRFKKLHYSPTQMVMSAIFGEPLGQIVEYDDVLCNYLEEQNFETDIERVKVAKTLRLVLDKKSKQ